VRYAIIAAWQRFREVRHQQRVNGYEGPLSVYAAFYAELGDWQKVLMSDELIRPGMADVPFMWVGKRTKEPTP
jgi:hypothetical protein